jgi:hypothetical protein
VEGRDKRRQARFVGREDGLKNEAAKVARFVGQGGSGRTKRAKTDQIFQSLLEEREEVREGREEKREGENGTTDLPD